MSSRSILTHRFLKAATEYIRDVDLYLIGRRTTVAVKEVWERVAYGCVPTGTIGNAWFSKAASWCEPLFGVEPPKARLSCFDQSVCSRR
jgi:hypothetical protein